MVFGTFDFLHLGHLNFFEQAKKLGDKLIVVVSRDSNAEKLKGKAPFFSEKERLKIVKSLKVVDEAILGDEYNFFSAVEKYSPDVIALGYDQKSVSQQDVQKKLDKLGLKTRIIKLKNFKGKFHKSSMLKKYYEVE